MKTKEAIEQLTNMQRWIKERHEWYEALNMAISALKGQEKLWSLEHALLLMVYQYCQLEEREEQAIMFHSFMCAGEEAFDVLGIENGCDPKIIWDRIEKIESGGTK